MWALAMASNAPTHSKHTQPHPTYLYPISIMHTHYRLAEHLCQDKHLYSCELFLSSSSIRAMS